MKRALLVCALVAGASCTRSEQASNGSFEVPLVADAPADDAIVATVDGRPIRASDVATQARAAGSDAKAALDALVEAEVLAGEAKKKHLDRDPEAVLAAREASVRQLLKSGFEAEHTVDKLPDRRVRGWFNAHTNMYDHSEYVDVWHILIPVAKNASAADRQAARAAAEELARKAKSTRTAEAFKALAQTVPKALGEPKIEQIITAEDGWVEKPFSVQAFKQLKQPGDTTSVVETSYGYHVEFLNRYIPARHATLDEVRREMGPQLLPVWRRDEFPRWVQELERKHTVVVHPERIP